MAHVEGMIGTRAMTGGDTVAVAALLDDALGRGSWSIDPHCAGSRRVAVHDGLVVGIVAATVVPSVPQVDWLQGPVGVLRLASVHPGFRGRGIATRLTAEACDHCRALGAVTLLAFAWVHAASGVAPSAHVLERLGFVRGPHLEHFFSSLALAEPCPGCARTPCACAVDVYTRQVADRSSPADAASTPGSSFDEAVGGL